MRASFIALLLVAAFALTPVAALAQASPDGRWRARVHHKRVEIEPSGAILPGYPPPLPDGTYGEPRTRHRPARLERVAFDARSELVAVAGTCFGESGVSSPVTPSCAPGFVRVHRLTNGRLVSALEIPWTGVTDAQRVLAMSFDEASARIAVLTRHRWSDCSWDGTEMHLHVYRVADGALVEQRVLSRRGAGGQHELTLRGDGVHLVTRWGSRVRSRDIRLRSAQPVP